MALPDSLKIITGTEFIFSKDADWAGGTVGWDATRDAELDMSDVATTAFEQSAKADLTDNRDPLYEISMTLEMATDPGNGEVINIYAGYSYSETAGTGNPAGLSGATGPYTGYGGESAANCIKQLDHVGTFVLAAMNDLDAPQVGVVGYLQPRGRYLMLVVENASAVSFHSDCVETAIRVRGITHQAQD